MYKDPSTYNAKLEQKIFICLKYVVKAITQKIYIKVLQ